ncbi:MAG TPA: head GIN domain-containing protein [Mucilaginibacter sp.]|jgi:uncharacterized protein YaiE (UPF0345 family)
MKKIAYSVFTAILLMIAVLKVSAQSEQTRQVSGFNKIASGGPFDVHVKIDGTETLKINANPDIINEIETIVESGSLKIRFKHHDDWNHENTGKIDIYVTAKSLSAVSNAGSGSIKIDGVVNGEKVTFNLSGSGDISSSVKSGELHVSISGSGSVHLEGNANDSNISIAGSGELNGKKLRTGSASVSIAGSGSAYFIADKTVSASIVGSGNVIYSGNATMSDVRTVGSGRVSKE